MQVAQCISKGGGFFIILSGGSLPHFNLELLRHLLASTGQKVAGGQDLLKILFAGHIPDARRGAELQMAVKTVPVVLLVGCKRTAAPQVELPSDQRQRVTQS